MWLAGLVAVAFLALPAVPARALPLFQFSSTTLSFPDTAVGVTSAALDVTVTNLSGSPQTLSSVAGGAPSDGTNFGATQNCAGITLAAGASCAFSYTFHPTATGPLSTTTAFTINGESSGIVTLSGTAVPAFTIAPTTLSFPDTSLGVTSAAIDVTVTNVSGASQVLSSVAGGAPSDGTNFGATQSCAGITLAAGASCAFSYTFHPTTLGAHSTTTSFSINGQSSGTITLSGTGLPAFTITPTTLAFPDTSAGSTSSAIDVVVTNVSGASQVLSSVAGGAPSDGTNFGAVQNCAGITLLAGASCAFSYTFHPAAAGIYSTTTSFTINGQTSGTITLSGATPGATPSPTPTPTLTPTASASATASTSTGSGLADTGSSVGALPGLGAIMLVVSGVALVGSRRRSAR